MIFFQDDTTIFSLYNKISMRSDKLLKNYGVAGDQEAQEKLTSTSETHILSSDFLSLLEIVPRVIEKS